MKSSLLSAEQVWQYESSISVSNDMSHYKTMKLILPFPPSVNTYWRAPNSGPLKGRHLISAKGRAYQSAACAAIIEQLRRLPKPSAAAAAVEIVLYPPDARRRDIDNYNKALFDALTHAGVWEDDSQVKRMLVEWGPQVPGGKVEISIAIHGIKRSQNRESITDT